MLMKNAQTQKNNLIRIEEITLTLEDDERVLINKIADILAIETKEVIDYAIVKRALDSRNKSKILFVYSVDVKIKAPENYFSESKQGTYSTKEKNRRHKVRIQEHYIYKIKSVLPNAVQKRPIVVGTGPSGLFSALLLAMSGLKPLVIERGKDVDSRINDVGIFFSTGKLNVNSNIQFGEGGAGTFSDGKLNTLVNNPKTKFVFAELIKAGAPEEIAWDATPHIGTDKLHQIVKNLRKKIIDLGGDVFFETCLTDIEVKNNTIVSAVFNNKERVLTDDLVVATGHSARDTYEMLHKRNLEIKAKPFSMGVRIEHKAEMINKSQYGNFYSHAKLPTAKYKLVCHLPQNRSVYTFCMCPGGYVIAAASEEGMLVINGMSKYARNGINSNSALLVNVGPDDFGSEHPLAGIEFQRQWERKVFLTGGSNYKAPVQLVGDFLANKASTSIKSVLPTYKPGITLTSLNDCLPSYIIDSLRASLPLFDRKMHGFAYPDALLTGIETRSSSPVRILRDKACQSNIRGIYPAGEGAGYAGGIISSAIDGLVVAEAIIEKYSRKH